jgi:hypothetical protein
VCDTMQAAVSISSPVPVAWYPTLAVAMVVAGLMLTASFFMYVSKTLINRPNLLASDTFVRTRDALI